MVWVGADSHRGCPALPTFDIGEGALDKVLALYKALLPSLGGYLTQAGELHLGRLEALLTHIAAMEQQVLEERASVGHPPPLPWKQTGWQRCQAQELLVPGRTQSGGTVRGLLRMAGLWQGYTCLRAWAASLLAEQHASGLQDAECTRQRAPGVWLPQGAGARADMLLCAHTRAAAVLVKTLQAAGWQDAEFLDAKRARREGRESGAYVVPGRRQQDELDAALREQLAFQVRACLQQCVQHRSSSPPAGRAMQRPSQGRRAGRL